MDTLYSWNAKRAGGRITVLHSCGKIPHVDTIQPENGTVIATASDGRKYSLHVPASAETPRLSFDESRYLAALVSGEYTPDFWNDNARKNLIDKLTALGLQAVQS